MWIMLVWIMILNNPQKIGLNNKYSNHCLIHRISCNRKMHNNNSFVLNSNRDKKTQVCRKEELGLTCRLQVQYLLTYKERQNHIVLGMKSTIMVEGILILSYMMIMFNIIIKCQTQVKSKHPPALLREGVNIQLQQG